MNEAVINYIINQITPLDSATAAVKYYLQISFPGPTGTTTGPYVYRENKTNIVSLGALYLNTDVTQTVTVTGSYNSVISDNFQVANQNEILSFYQRAYYNAQSYFANISFGNTSVQGYTGSINFTGSGITGSYIMSPTAVNTDGNFPAAPNDGQCADDDDNNVFEIFNTF